MFIHIRPLCVQSGLIKSEYIHIYMYACIYIYIYIHIHIHTYTNIHMYIHVQLFIHIRPLCVVQPNEKGIYIHIYTYIYIYIHTLIYICIHTCIPHTYECTHTTLFCAFHLYIYICVYIDDSCHGYGVATIIYLLQGSFAKETYNFKENTNRSHPIPMT